MMRLRHTLLVAAAAALSTQVLASCGSDAKPSQNAGAGGDPSGSGATAGTDTGIRPIGFGGSGGKGGAGSGVSCGTTNLSASLHPVNLLIVLDRSGSMLNPLTLGASGASGTAGAPSTKWAALQSALSTALDGQPDALSVGLLPFPSIPVTGSAGSPSVGAECRVVTSADAVAVPIAPVGTAKAAVAATLSSSTPSGGTPTAAALTQALEYFTKGAGASLTGDKVVLLATDGGPNCNSGVTCTAATCTVNLDGKCPAGGVNCCDDPNPPAPPAVPLNAYCLDGDRTLTQVQALKQAGISTIVVGIPGSEVPEYVKVLNDAATAGGYAQSGQATSYFAVSSTVGVAGLTKVLSDITHNLVKTCELELGKAPPDPDRVNVELDGKVVPQGPDGWDFTPGSNNTKLSLLGSTCTQVSTLGVQRVQVTFGCPTIKVR